MNWYLVITISVFVTIVMSLIMYMFGALTLGVILSFAASALLSSILTNFATKPKTLKSPE